MQIVTILVSITATATTTTTRAMAAVVPPSYTAPDMRNETKCNVL